jgi:hypothetical protein
MRQTGLIPGYEGRGPEPAPWSCYEASSGKRFAISSFITAVMQRCPSSS